MMVDVRFCIIQFLILTNVLKKVQQGLQLLPVVEKHLQEK